MVVVMGVQILVIGPNCLICLYLENCCENDKKMLSELESLLTIFFKLDCLAEEKYTDLMNILLEPLLLLIVLQLK